jgi:hypothetical protein
MVSFNLFEESLKLSMLPVKLSRLKVVISHQVLIVQVLSLLSILVDVIKLNQSIKVTNLFSSLPLFFGVNYFTADITTINRGHELSLKLDEIVNIGLGDGDVCH